MAGSLLVVLLVLLTAHLQCQTTATTCNPPGLDSHSRTLTCSGSFETESRHRRSLHWETLTPDETRLSRAVCHSTEKSCHVYDGYIATASFRGKNYTTTLEIPNIPQKECKGIEFRIYDKETDSANLIQSWEMPKMEDSVNRMKTTMVHVGHALTNEIDVSRAAKEHAKEDIKISSRTTCTEHSMTSLLLCTATMLPSPAKLLWFINDKLFTGSNKAEISVVSGYYKAESSMFSDFNSTHPRQIKCEAHYSLNGTAKNISKTTTILPRPNPPYFLYKGKRIPRNELSITEGEIIDNLVCQVHGSNPPVTAVRCQTSNSSKQTISQIRYGASVACPLNYTKINGRYVCTCIAHYESACYNTTSSSTLLAMVGDALLQQPVSSKINIYYITIGCSVIVCIIFILGMCIYVIRRWDTLYIYANSLKRKTIAGASYDDYHEYTSIGSVAGSGVQSQTLPRNYKNITMKPSMEISTNALSGCICFRDDNDTASTYYSEPVIVDKVSPPKVVINADKPNSVRSIFSQTFVEKDVHIDRAVKSRRFLRRLEKSVYNNLLQEDQLHDYTTHITRQSAQCKHDHVQFKIDTPNQKSKATKSPRVLHFGIKAKKKIFSDDYINSV